MGPDSTLCQGALVLLLDVQLLPHWHMPLTDSNVGKFASCSVCVDDMCTANGSHAFSSVHLTFPSSMPISAKVQTVVLLSSLWLYTGGNTQGALDGSQHSTCAAGQPSAIAAAAGASLPVPPAAALQHDDGADPAAKLLAEQQRVGKASKQQCVKQPQPASRQAPVCAALQPIRCNAAAAAAAAARTWHRQGLGSAQWA
jgi:hypothetical protein